MYRQTIKGIVGNCSIPARCKGFQNLFILIKELMKKMRTEYKHSSVSFISKGTKGRENVSCHQEQTDLINIIKEVEGELLLKQTVRVALTMLWACLQ